jgi:hypothetical protein
MSHWAKINENNIVEYVCVGDNNDPAGDEGYQWLIDNIGGRWVKTSYNTFLGVHKEGGEPFRKNFASPDYIYDETRDAFIAPKPDENCILNEETCGWEYPDAGSSTE